MDIKKNRNAMRECVNCKRNVRSDNLARHMRTHTHQKRRDIKGRFFKSILLPLPGEVQPPEVHPPEVQPREVHPPEVQPPEVHPPEVHPREVQESDVDTLSEASELKD